MSSRFRAARAATLTLALALAAAGCDREERQSRSKPLPETAPGATVTGTLYAGSPLPGRVDPRAAEYENNSYHIAQGQRLFSWMNCVGCHAHGGGGMGPPLMDDQWRYGAEMPQIVSTIVEGRPNGMPSFRGKVTEQQAWQLAAFVRSLSAQPRQDALPARADEMSNTEPLTLQERQPVRNASPAGADGTTQ